MGEVIFLMFKNSSGEKRCHKAVKRKAIKKKTLKIKAKENGFKKFTESLYINAHSGINILYKRMPLRACILLICK
jgi:hypothetical protein